MLNIIIIPKFHKIIPKKSPILTFYLFNSTQSSPKSNIYPKKRFLNPHKLNPNKPLTKPQLKTLINSQLKPPKFTNLLRNIVSLPSLLLTAAQNLISPTRSPPLTLNSVATQFDLFQLAHELTHNQFDPETHCITLDPPKNRIFRDGYALVLPNLKLKVVIEAIRLVLDAIYDDDFTSFCYGGRDGLGRHTAVRYLKKSVESPSWWFRIKFSKQNVFDCRHVSKLCDIIRCRVDDEMFVGLILRLFECNVIRIELGKGVFGKGLPQECGLCGILINIYFDGFDQKVQKNRARMSSSNPVGVDKPVKLYAVRYLDEMLMVTSGSQELASDYMKWSVKYMEEKLELCVDKFKSRIHSATDDGIDFLGMSIRAVPPGVIRPPLTEKAKRARKKFQRQKEVRLLELRNKKERNRKLRGRRVFRHVFKKLRKGCEFKFEYRIEDEMREIVRTWGDEVTREFLGSLDERTAWHHSLTAGDFLSLKRIRDQLPVELVDAYDKFQREVDKHISPVPLRKAIADKQRREEEEEERIYNERVIADLTKLCMKVIAPMEHIRKAVRLAGFTNSLGRPRPISLLTALEDVDIVKWYAGIGLRWLEYFACCRNIEMVRTTVTYHLRYSCLLTLAEKHDATKNQTIQHFTKDLKVLNEDGNEEVYFPTMREVKKFGDYRLADPKPVDSALTMCFIRLAYDEPLHTCRAHFCERNDTVTYRVCLLQNELDINPMDKSQWVSGMAAVHDSLDRKCFPLCAEHISELYMGRLTLQDIDCTSFVDVG